MICPECGSLTSNDQAFCTNCGAFVRSRFGKILSQEPSVGPPPVPAVEGRHEIAPADALDEIEWAAIESDLAPDDPDPELWPQETVFVPTLDEVPASPSTEIPAAPDPVFEDAQADDFFEQSLSGRIRREDLDAEEALTEPATQQVAEEVDADRVGRVTAEFAVPDLFTDQPAESIAEEAAAAPAIPLRRPAPRRLGAKLAMLAYLLTVPLVFAGGVWLGSLYSELSGLPMPSVGDVPPVGLAPAAPVPPHGMAFVPGGEFVMGSDLGDPLSRPAHPVVVGPFFMDRFEVTNAEYGAFIKATGQQPPNNWQNGALDPAAGRLPVTGVTWYQAAEYAAWAGKRLPTEAEWEYAARGTDGRLYPWGDEWDPERANVDGTSPGVSAGSTSGASPFGIYDMSGNAWEWTSSDARPYPGGKQFPWSRLRLKVIRGGNWLSGERAATAVFRGYYGADGEKDYSGTSFRCVKDIPGLR